MRVISKELGTKAVETFAAYEAVVVGRVLCRPGWRLDPAPLQRVLDAGDEGAARAFVTSLDRGRDEFLTSVIVRPSASAYEEGGGAPVSLARRLTRA